MKFTELIHSDRFKPNPLKNKRTTEASQKLTLQRLVTGLYEDIEDAIRNKELNIQLDVDFVDLNEVIKSFDGRELANPRFVHNYNILEDEAFENWAETYLARKRTYGPRETSQKKPPSAEYLRLKEVMTQVKASLAELDKLPKDEVIETLKSLVAAYEAYAENIPALPLPDRYAPKRRS